MLTFGELKSSTIVNIAGVCSSSTLFKQYVNKAVRQLLNRDDWAGTLVPIYLCVMKGCCVLPKWVAQIRRVNICNVPIPVNTLYYSFIKDCNWRSWCGPKASLNYLGQSPVFQQILGEGRLVRVYASVPEDYNKTVRIFGMDNNGQPLRTDNLDGTWSDGIDIEILSPFGSTTTYVRRIDRILKDKTQGLVRLFAYDVATDTLETLVTLDPNETNPSFARYDAKLPCCVPCGEPTGLLVLAKLKYIPVVEDTDIVAIRNIDALEMMIQSIKFREAGDRESAVAWEMDSIRELNCEARMETPDDAMPVSLGEFGSLCVGQQVF